MSQYVMRFLVATFLSLFSIQSLQAQSAYPSSTFRMSGSFINDAIHIFYTSSPTNLILNKRIAGTGAAFVQIETLSSAGGEYIDSDVIEGVIYEYTTTNGTTRTLQCGGKLPLVEQKGWYVILIDSAITAGTTTEFKKFKQNLFTDGYLIKTIQINRNQTPDEVRGIIQQTNNDLPGGIKQLLLLGHIPVPYSGLEGHDVHLDHDGAWATDTYYADLDGDWIDIATVDYPTRDANKNFPGDRKFDHDTMPSPADIEVGRVDMFDLPAFGLSETALINRYLAKNNLFKSGNLTIVGSGLETVGSGYLFSEILAGPIAPCVGINGLAIGPYNSLVTQPRLFSFGYGASNYTTCGGVVSTTDFVNSSWFTVFTGLLGSYLWDFDFSNSVMRASLFSNGSILSCSFYTDFWEFMGLGMSIGEVNKMNQTHEMLSASNLHGDPSVRINYPIKPTELTLSINSDTSQIELNWLASIEVDEPLIGYHVYRTQNTDSALLRLTALPILETNFLDLNPLPGKNYYVVKLITLRPSGSGSFYNSSIGLIDSVIVPNQPSSQWDIQWNLNQSYCQGEEVSNIQIEVLNGTIQNDQIKLEISNVNGSFENPSFSEVIDIVGGEISFEMPNLPINNQFYSLRILDLSQDFTESFSSDFNYNSLPTTSLDYSINYDTLLFHIIGNINYISSVEISPSSSISVDDTLFIFAEEGEFTFTINSQNTCGSFQSIDTINSTLNGGIVTVNESNPIISNFTFYPNPVIDYLFVENRNGYTWEVFNAFGERTEFNYENLGEKTRFNLRKLSPGMYYLRSIENPKESFKLIKQ